MPNILIRDVPGDDLDQIRSAASARGMSMQAYLRETVHAHAAHVRRRTALARAAERLRGTPGVTEQERAAVRAAIDEGHAERAEQLGSAPGR